MTDFAGCDPARVPFEITRALDRAGLIPELLEPGLASRNAGDAVEVIEPATGRVLCEVPLYRLKEHDALLVVKAVAESTAGNVAEADQWHAAITTGDLLIEAPPDRDEVVLSMRHDRERWIRVHRSVVVEGWPWGED